MHVSVTDAKGQLTDLVRRPEAGDQGGARRNGGAKPGLSRQRGRNAEVIVADTSAPMAIILREPLFEECVAVLEAEPEVLISAGTVRPFRPCMAVSQSRV